MEDTAEFLKSADQDAQETAAREVREQEEFDRSGTKPEDGGDPRRMGVDTAFVVFVQDGVAYGVGDLGEVSIRVEGEEMFLEPSRPADTDTMWRGCTEVAKDIQVHQQAAKTVEALQAHTLQMQAALQKQQTAGGSRLHVPKA